MFLLSKYTPYSKWNRSPLEYKGNLWRIGEKQTHGITQGKGILLFLIQIKVWRASKAHSQKSDKQNKACISYILHITTHSRSIHVKIKDGEINWSFIFDLLWRIQTRVWLCDNELHSFHKGSLSWNHHCVKGHSQTREEPRSGSMIPSHSCHFVPCLEKKNQTGAEAFKHLCPFACVQEQRGLFLSGWWESPISASHVIVRTTDWGQERYLEWENSVCYRGLKAGLIPSCHYALMPANLPPPWGEQGSGLVLHHTVVRWPSLSTLKLYPYQNLIFKMLHLNLQSNLNLIPLKPSPTY